MKQQSYFRHLTSKLLESEILQDFNSIIHTIEKEFPNTNSWLNWWLKSTHSRMLFPAIRISLGEDDTMINHLQGLSLILRISLNLETSNRVESLHFQMYRACGLQSKGKRLGILEGIRKLYLYCQDLERTYELALRIIILI